MPNDIQTKIWKIKFSEVIRVINTKKPGISWCENKSTRLKEMLKNEIGTYQYSHTDFDIKRLPCMMCSLFNFPCIGCADYIYNNKLEPQIFILDREFLEEPRLFESTSDEEHDYEEPGHIWTI